MTSLYAYLLGLISIFSGAVDGQCVNRSGKDVENTKYRDLAQCDALPNVGSDRPAVSQTFA